MPTRRDFLRSAMALTGSAGLMGAIERAFAIEPEKDSTFLDAEHVVILMQENRSFDHAFGSLRGVRGFNDPRAIRLPDGNPVWVQSNAAGEKYTPFRLDIKETKITWMGCLPHNWTDQVDATNGGKHDRWLQVKRPGNKSYASMPLTLGYYSRDDIPFYYALADAFTICDQNFCSTLTGTTANRLHLWTGTIREKPNPELPALVRNEDCSYGHWVNWTTFPERLEDHGVSWKIYQNELTVPTGLSEEADAWLSNFGCSPIEWFTQFHVRFAANHRAYLEQRVKTLPGDITKLETQLASQVGEAAEKTKKRIADLKAQLARFQKDRVEFTAANYERLSARQKNLHARAFTTNAGDPAYRELQDLTYKDGEATRRLMIPKGDVLYQFRKDVQEGKLPTVSWIVPPERLSDHPCSAWYGQWYLSEVMNILTKNPEVWKKTVFILTYDENDGYFDHVPPFQAPHPKKAETGLASKGIDTSLEHLEVKVDRTQKRTGAVRGNSLGLGYRVPMIIASPWTRGGCVCSQVFDHTSVLQFLERLLTHKTGKPVEETNITRWRRTVCGDLTSAFQTAADRQARLSGFLKRDPFVEGIHKAQFKKTPNGFRPLTETEIVNIRAGKRESVLPKQEPGVRPSSPLPYELDVEGSLNDNRDRFVLRLAARNGQFGRQASGAPFIAYAFTDKGLEVRHYTVAAGDQVTDSWPVGAFVDGRYHFRVHGPNGFFREFVGGVADHRLDVHLTGARASNDRQSLTGDVQIIVANRSEGRPLTVQVRDHAYGQPDMTVALPASRSLTLTIESSRSNGWHDFSVYCNDSPGWENRYAGRWETGMWSISDPNMGRSL